MYMSGSGYVTPENPPERHFAIQVGDTLRRPESIASHGFQRFALTFNRTAVTVYQVASGLFGALQGTAVADEIQRFAWMNGQATAEVYDVHSYLNKNG
jgi:hypothetical protein